MRSFLISLTRNPLGLLGAAITTASAILIITLFAIELFGFLGNPYVGILAYLILPGIFLFGLMLIPLGVWQQRRRERLAAERGDPAPTFPVIDLNVRRVRRFILSFLVLSAANVIILATATFKGVEVMESTEFCGTTCHTVMQPEHTAHQRSPHSRVKCVDCHIGPGADWFVKSKLSGAWQVVSVAFDLYPRPIATPVHDLRPARETCEQCHLPSKFVGDRMLVKTLFADDEENTELKSVLVMKIGGQRGDASHGIHWHVDPNIQIRYRSDEKRETMYEVELTDEDGKVKHFVGPQADEAGDDLAWRVMDCVDCHNRPTHIYRMPEDEVDQAMAAGQLPRSLPYLRREGVRAMKAEYSSPDDARSGITGALEAFYRESYPDQAAGRANEIESAGAQLAELWAANVFPKMKVGWGTYPDHRGHMVSDGCFRCHSDEHETEDGEVIPQDCFECHALLAIEEESPEILQQLE